MDRKIEFELDYWRQAKRTEHDARQRKILDLWGFSGAPSVLEIGTGPWGGCLPFVEADIKWGVDPLYVIYANEGLLGQFDASTWNSGIEDFLLSGPTFDAILSMNALDHGESDFGAIKHIAALLNPGGRFYLHVHLRRPDQLNVGHDHALRIEDLDAATSAAGLREIRKTVYDADPVEGAALAPYKTVIGIWEKPC